jgi:hypothetical protein
MIRRLAVGGCTSEPIEVMDDATSPQTRVVPIGSASHRTQDRLRLRALALGVPFLHLPPVVPAECRGALAPSLARELRAVPVGRTDSALTVALDARWDARLIFRLRVATGLDIFPVLTLAEELDRALLQLGEDNLAQN